MFSPGLVCPLARHSGHSSSLSSIVDRRRYRRQFSCLGGRSATATDDPNDALHGQDQLISNLWPYSTM